MPVATWSQVEYIVETDDAHAIRSFVTAMTEQFVNGDCVIRQFIAKDPSHFDAALAHDRQGVEHWLGAFLSRPEVRASLAVIRIAEAESITPAFRTIGAYEFEGALVEILLGGGAYSHGVGSEERARVLAKDFVDSLLGENRRHCTLFVIDGPWTPWFFDVAWDYSYLLFDTVARRWSTLFMTDTD